MTAWGRNPCVYQCFDRNGVLLYVGQTLDPPARIQDHRSTARFWRLVHTIELIHTETAAEAKSLETGLIRAQQPLFNVVGSDEYANRP